MVGSGVDDQNIDADITSVGYDVQIRQAANTNTKFDLYAFAGNDNDYNCFVMGSQLWTDYGLKHECDFLTMRPEVVMANIDSYTESSEHFLGKDAKSNEVFFVIDNSGWYKAVTNSRITQEDATQASSVYLELSLTTTYKDNDIYNQVYYGFIICAGVAAFFLLVFMVLLKCQRVKYNRLMEQKSQFK